jgi:hypothetical protein
MYLMLVESLSGFRFGLPTDIDYRHPPHALPSLESIASSPTPASTPSSRSRHMSLDSSPLPSSSYGV